MKAGYQHCSIPMELRIRSSFSPYQSRHFLSSHVPYALVTRGSTQNCKSIFSRTLSNIPLKSNQPESPCANGFANGGLGAVERKAVGSLYARFSTANDERLRRETHCSARKI